MFKTLLSLLFPVVLASSSARVESKIYIEGNGSVSVNNQSSATANGQSVSVTSEEPGEISVEVKDGKVTVKKDPQSKPTIIITGAAQSEVKIEENKNIDDNQTDKSINKAKPVLEIIRQILVRLSALFKFGKKNR